MRRRLVAGISLLTAACALCAGLLSECFSPTLPDCAFLCGPPDMNPPCPESYTCQKDGICHLMGTDNVCPFTVDLLPAVDLLVVPDGGIGDGSTHDGGRD